MFSQPSTLIFIDKSDGIKLVAKKLVDYKANTICIKADFSKLPIKEKVCNTVISVGSINFSCNQEEIFSNIQGASKNIILLVSQVRTF